MTCHAHALAESRGFLTEQDVNCIRRLAKHLPKDNALVADIGAGAGTTALAVFAEREPGTVRIVSIDNNEVELSWMQQAVANIGRTGDHRAILGDAVALASEVPDGELDLLLIDISYGVEAIARAWLPKLKQGGIIWMHDYGDPRKFGIDQDAVVEPKQTADALEAEGLIVQGAARGLGWRGRVPREKAEEPPEEFPSMRAKPAKRAERTKLRSAAKRGRSDAS